MELFSPPKLLKLIAGPLVSSNSESKREVPLERNGNNSKKTGKTNNNNKDESSSASSSSALPQQKSRTGSFSTTAQPGKKSLAPPPPPPRKVNKGSRTFEVHGTNGRQDVRRALRSRGWIDKSAKKEDRSSSSINNVPSSFSAQSAFIWSSGKIPWEIIREDQIVNQIPSPMFSFMSKVGLVSCLQNSHWFRDSDKANINFPRCYRLSARDERSAFLSDYLLTACISFLQYIVDKYEQEGQSGIMAESGGGGTIPSSQWIFALQRVKHYVGERNNDHLDDPKPRSSSSSSKADEYDQDAWLKFVESHRKLVHRHEKLDWNGKLSLAEDAEAKYSASKEAIGLVAPFWPQLNIDGHHNIWICKPGELCRGQGIFVLNDINRILELSPHRNKAWMNWVVQKYIERPLLIYKTKFDIRQWFLVSRWSPLAIWFYTESYLRFCSKPFSIDDLHERIHLCNHSVQSKYSIWKTRSPKLPSENMWDTTTFREYLKKEGKEELWEGKIYPGMKQSILTILLSSQDQFFHQNVAGRKNSFQLFGADFMISDSFEPWLIEINSSPDMSKDTKVTKLLCESCIEDSIKVIIDRREDREADTGKFQLIYQEAESPYRMGNVHSYAFVSDVTIRGTRFLSKHLRTPVPSRSKHLKGLKSKGNVVYKEGSVSEKNIKTKSTATIKKRSSSLSVAYFSKRRAISSSLTVRSMPISAKSAISNNNNNAESSTTVATSPTAKSKQANKPQALAEQGVRSVSAKSTGKLYKPNSIQIKRPSTPKS